LSYIIIKLFQIAELRESITQETAEEERLRGKLHVILPEIVAHRDRQLFPLEPTNDVIGMSEIILPG